MHMSSTDAEEHLQHLRLVGERLSNYGIVINPSKCVLGVPELDFLGHRVDRHGVRPLEEKNRSDSEISSADHSTQAQGIFGNGQLLSPLRSQLCTSFATA